jgi:hypothetical protein
VQRGCPAATNCLDTTQWEEDFLNEWLARNQNNLYPYFVLFFSFSLLLLGIVANTMLLLDQPHKPGAQLYAVLVTLLGVLGANVGIALKMMAGRIRKLEERLAAVTPSGQP